MFQGVVVNQALASLHRGSFEATLLLKRPSLLSKMATKLELFSVLKLIKIRMKQSIFLVKKTGYILEMAEL